MTQRYTLSPFTDRHDRARLAQILSQGFSGNSEGTAKWLDRFGTENVHVLESGPGSADFVGCLRTIPMGQFFGAKSVPLIGIAAVATAPECRGTGAGSELMRQCVLNARRTGAPLSGLYPAIQPFYRRVGYEQAGGRFEHRMTTRAIGVRSGGADGAGDSRGARVRPMTPADAEPVRDVYRAWARQHHGFLDRAEYIWKRIEKPRQGEAEGYVVEESGRVTAYAWVMWKDPPTGIGQMGRRWLELTDAAASTPAAARTLLSFLAGYGSRIETITFCGGPTHAFLAMLPEQTYSSHLLEHWMIRVLDVAKALEARGYPRALSAVATIDVSDELIPENAGRYALTVRDGAARVERAAASSGAGAGRMDIRALASLYAGFLTPWQLSLMGRMEAPPETLDSLGAIFAGPTPAMPDMY